MQVTVGVSYVITAFALFWLLYVRHKRKKRAAFLTRYFPLANY